MIPKIHQEVTYSVKPEDRVVIAFVSVSYSVNGVAYISSPSTGVAKCHPEDEWDEVIGKRIAESRAIQKVMKKVKRYIKYKLEDLNKEVNALSSLSDKVEQILSKEVDHEVSIKEGL